MNNFIKMAFVGTVLGLSYGVLFGYALIQVQALQNVLKNQNNNQIINCANCDFRGADLRSLDLHGIYAPGISLQPCMVTTENKDNGFMICDPSKSADLTGTNLANGNCSSSCFDNAKLDKADLSGLDLSNSSVQNASLKDAKVGGIKTTNATFCNSVMPDGKICTETWSGQGVTIVCNCSANQLSKNSKPVKQADLQKDRSAKNAQK